LLTDDPKRLVEPDILIDPLDGARRHPTSATAILRRSTTSEETI
jgi:hypothetical protein